MTRKDALAELIAKVEAGGNPSQAEWVEVFPDTPDDDDYPRSLMATQASVGWLDAANALHEAVLCAGDPQYGYLVGPMYARIVHPSCGTVCDAQSHNPARAWLLSILRALHAMEPSE